MTTSKLHHHDISSSKRTMINNIDQTIDNNPIISPRSSRLSKSKPESGSEEVVYPIPSNNRVRQGMSDHINDEFKTKSSIERTHHLSTNSNNSAVRLQQQGMGDHYQHRNRSKTVHRKSHRLIEQQNHELTFDEKNEYRWRLIMYIIIVLILAFVIYRFLIAIWPKQKKTFMEQLIDDLSNFFTP